MILSQPIIYKTQTNYNLVARDFLKQTWNLSFVCVYQNGHLNDLFQKIKILI